MRRPHWLLLLVAAGALVFGAGLFVHSPRRHSFEVGLTSVLRRWLTQDSLRGPDVAVQECSIPAMHRRRAQDRLREGKPEQALAEIETAARVDPNDMCTECCRGMIAGEAGDWPRSAEIYAGILPQEPCCSVAQLGLARAYLEMGRAEKARSLAEEALKSEPRSLNAHCCVARLASDREDWKMAARDFSRAVSLDPTFSDPHRHLARVYAETQQLKKARAELQEALQLDPECEFNHCCAASLAGEEADWKTAAREYYAALRIDPHLTGAHLGLAEAYAELKQFKEAMNTTQRAAAEDPGSPDVQCCQGRIHLEMSQWRDAESHLRRARQMGGRDAELYRQLGEALDHQNRAKEFLAEAQTAVKIAPKEAASHCCLGRAYGRVRRWRDAVKAFETASELDADVPDLQDNLAWARRHLASE